MYRSFVLSIAQSVLGNVHKLSVEKIVQFSKPTFVDGRWRAPKLNKRRLAELRTKFLLAGREWPLEKPVERGTFGRGDKPPKRQIHDREPVRLARIKKIEENLAKMPKLIADMKKARQAEREKKRVVKGLALFWRPKRVNKRKTLSIHMQKMMKVLEKEKEQEAAKKAANATASTASTQSATKSATSTTKAPNAPPPSSTKSSTSEAKATAKA